MRNPFIKSIDGVMNMADIRKGSFCKSTAGHDKDTYYIIVDVNPIKVSDGKLKGMAKAKIKNPKHLEIIDYRDSELDLIIEKNQIRDENIKYSIKKYLAHIEK